MTPCHRARRRRRSWNAWRDKLREVTRLKLVPRIRRRLTGVRDPAGRRRNRQCLLSANSRLPPLVYEFVGAQRDGLGDAYTECPRRFKVDDQHELNRLFDRQDAGLCALEDFVNVLR